MFSYLFDYFKDKKEPEIPENIYTTKYTQRSKSPPTAKPFPRSKTPLRSKPTYTEKTRVSPIYTKFTRKTDTTRPIPSKNTEYINLCRLTDKTEICNISPCIKKITGLPTDSSSPTDTWIVDFKENVYYNTHKIEKGFLKIFLNPNSPGISNSRRIDLLALDYEINIYKDVIKNLIEYKICPNFIKYLASGINCSFENLNSMLNGNIYTNTGEVISSRQTAANLIRNIIFLQYEINENNDKRPAINDNRELNYRYPAVNIGFKYNMLMSEDSNAIKFSSWIMNNIRNRDFEQELYNVLFQVFVACYSMSLSKLVHNDLHAGNVFIRTSLIKDRLYYINDIPTVIRSSFTALIYDFDRGYCEKFGNNPKLQDFECKVSSQCNIYIENKDIIKILCYIYAYVENDSIRNNLLELITSNNLYKRELVDTYRFRNSCFLHKDDIAQPPQFYRKFNDCETIINNLAKLIRKISSEDIEEINIFRCNKKYFMENGSLNTAKILKDRTKIKEISKKVPDEASYKIEVTDTECNNCVKEFENENIYDRKSFLKWSIKNHPDKGGDAEKFKILTNCNDLFYKYEKCDKSKIKLGPTPKTLVVPSHDVPIAKKTSMFTAPSSTKISVRQTPIVSIGKKPSMPTVPSKTSIRPTRAVPVAVSGLALSKSQSLSQIKNARFNKIKILLLEYLSTMDKIYDTDEYLEKLSSYINSEPKILSYFNGENILTENQVYQMLINQLENYSKMDISL